MATCNEKLLDQRDEDVLRAKFATIGSIASSPRRRWSPRGNGSPNRRSPRSNGSPSRWSPSRLSPSNKNTAYEELQGSNSAEQAGNEGIEIDENTKPALPADSYSILDTSQPLGIGYTTLTSPVERSLPSPSAKPRFSVPPLRQRGLGVQPLSPSKLTRNSTGSDIEQNKNSSPIFRFKVQASATKDHEPSIMPASHVQSSTDDDIRDAFDDFDVLVKERQVYVQLGTGKEHEQRQETELPSNPGNLSSSYLHELCASISTLDDLLRVQTFLKGHPDYASHIDLQGRTPLHVFSTNKILAAAIGVPNDGDLETHQFLRIHEQPTNDLESNQLEKHILRFLVGDLLAAHPGAIMVRDDQSKIPFEKSLIDWVEESHHSGISNDAGTAIATGFSYTSAMSNVWESTMKIAGRTSHFVAAGFAATLESPTRTANSMERGDSRSAIFSPDRRQQFAGMIPNGIEGKDSKHHSLPPVIRLTSQARFSITMLSAGLDQLERYLSPELVRRSLSRPDTIAENFIKAHEHLTAFQRQFGSVNIVDSVVETLASIPDLMYTILLIENDSDREYALSTSFVRRIMTSKKSVGPWLTKILQSRDRHLAQRAVDYLKLLSDEIVWLHPSNEKSSRIGDRCRNEDYLVDEVSQLRDFVPSLLALNERGIEDASTTSIVRQVMGRMISRPFAVTVIMCDAIFLAMLIIGFRYAVNSLIGGDSLDKVLQWIYVANMGIFYFIIREIGKTVSLFMISTRARSYFLSFWNLIDALTVMLALASTIVMRSYFTVLEKGLEDTSFLRGLLAITTGFIWLRVLSLLKAINIQLATFVLAILQITKDILWFCVILATLVVSFSQMFFTLLAPATCATGEGSDMVCKPTEYLLRTYSILLGDFGNFEREHFTTGFSVFLVVCYSFLVTVVLLNVLIAVASDSYEKCLLRSQHLFGRARVMLIAELVAFQTLLQTTEHIEQATMVKQGIYSRWRSSSTWIRHWSRASIMFFSLSVLVIAAWTVAELIGYAKGERYANIVFSLASVVVNVALFAVIMLFLATASSSRDDPGKKDVNRGFVQGGMMRLLGVDPDSDLSKKTSSAEWNGRVFYLEKEMKRIALEQRTTANQQAKFMENLINQTEMRLKAELELLEDNFVGLRDGIIQEVKGTKRTNQYITIAVQELKALLTASSSTTPQSPVPREVNLDRTRTIPPEKRDL